MSKNFRVFNVTRGYSMKFSRAERAVKECAAAWVEAGISIRSLTLAESIAARSEQARLREPLPYAEIHGLRFDPPASGTAATRGEGKLIWQAHDFALGAA